MQQHPKKTLYLIGGTMGVGKSTVCQILKRQLPQAVFLDGDWCWDAHPFVVNEETCAMVMDNITCLLNRFLSCSAYRNVIFCWVMHRQDIIDDILARLNMDNGATRVDVRLISLTCTPEALTARLQKDVDAGLRPKDIISRSVDRLPLYTQLHTELLDVSDITPHQVANMIASLCESS